MLIATISAVNVVAIAAQERSLAVEPGNPAFERTWARTDQPVLDGVTARTWMWGPEANTELLTESYADAADGERTVQYFDKSRMEINNPDADEDSIWYVTNGLLVVELMTGQMQVGDAQFEPRNPAEINIAGDVDDPNGPTYLTFAALRDVAPYADGDVITATVARDGTVGSDPALASDGVTAGEHVPETDHRVASVFWDFMTSTGPVEEDGQIVTDALFPNPFYATGLPVTEAYWAQVQVAGVVKWVLVQAFERRVLTYTPDNPDGWKVESGNVGQHYYSWRNDQEPEPVEAYKMSPWWPYLSAHIDDPDPLDVLGGPVTVNVTQEDGAATWVFPGKRKLDPAIFGTADDPKGTEMPAMALGVPAEMRETLPDGTQQTMMPTPFGNDFETTDGATLSMTAIDATATDGATSKDQVDFEATFQAPMGQGEYRVVVDMAAPHGWYAPTAGGVVTNIIQHGLTGWGTRLMPTEYVDVAFWGMGTIYKDGDIVAENRAVHVMVTETVRKSPYDLVFDDEVNPDFRHLHLIVPPFTPQGEMDPVTTGFTLPNDMEQPFMHVMFPNIAIESDAPDFTGELPEGILDAPMMPTMDPPADGPYLMSPWWSYVSAHKDDQDPLDIVGGPMVYQVTQDDGAANWVFPGKRKLDPAVFGTADDPKGTEMPAFALGVPTEMRETLPDGTQQTMMPTPFGNDFATTEGASLTMTAIDATSTDGAMSGDRVAFDATFQAPNEQGEYRVVVNMAAPHGWFVPTAGGVIGNFIQHGVTGWGTRLMPTEYVDVAFWGMGNIYLNDELVAEGRLVHVMVTESVRKSPYDLVFDDEVNPNFRQLHIVVPPFTPFGEMSDVTTGFTLPNDMEQPFLHVMFPNIEMEAGRLP